MSVCKGVKPERVFYYFEEISKIPRGSGNEAGIASYIERFAAEHSLFSVRDGADNVFIKRAAAPGFEDAPCVLLQGHTDMVCEKNSGTEHDFLNDPISLRLDGDFLCAEGTTLGADDGIAVAMMLALLEDEGLSCGALECLFTTGEEVGLCGMKAFDKGLISARYMINLDSESSDCAVISCAGGVRTDFYFEAMPLEKCPNKVVLTLGGLAGGHSGDDINRGRANAIKLAFEIVSKAEGARLISVTGGNKDNAIPRECVIEFSCDDVQEAIEVCGEAAEEIRGRLSECDGGFHCEIRYERGEFHAFSERNSRRVISLICSLPYGVIAMSDKVEDFVETSSNVVIIKSGKDSVTVTVSSRSSVESSLDDVTKTLDSLGEFEGATRVIHRDRYPGWEPCEVSRLQEIYRGAYGRICGSEARLEGIHAGLECGLIKDAIPSLDIISIGPDAYDIHTPDEKLSVSSVEKVYKIVIEMLEMIKMRGAF